MIKYKCNICNKETHLPKNRKGLSAFGRCVITKNCEGKMYKIDEMHNLIRIAEPISNNSWIQSKQIFTHQQTIPQSFWKFKHKLNCIPNIIVYINGIQIYDYETEFDEIHGKIIFKEKRIGYVQCIARNPTDVIMEPGVFDEYINVSFNKQLTIAVHNHNDLLVMDPLYKNAWSIYLNDKKVDYPLGYLNGAGAWNGTKQVAIHGNNYDVYSFNVFTDTALRNNFTAFAYIDEEPKGYILISKGPDPYDKEYTKVIDISKLNYENNYIKNNDLFVKKELVETCYPSILTI